MTLGFGLVFSRRGRLMAFASSFMVSLILRSAPLLMAIHHGAVWNALYFLPLWIGVELLLVAVFASWGYFGVLLSCLLSSVFHPLSLIHPLTLAGFESLLIILQTAVFWYDRFEHQTGSHTGDYVLSILLPCTVAAASTVILSLVFGDDFGIESTIEILVLTGQSFLAIFLTGLPARRVLSQRRQNPRGWISEWFILLFTEDVSQCYPASRPMTFQYEQPYRVDTYHAPGYTAQHRVPRDDIPLVMVSTEGEVICPNCGTSNWSSRNRCRRCRTPL